MYNENGSSAVSLNKGGCPVDNNSLSHTTQNCKYHIVFAPKSLPIKKTAIANNIKLPKNTRVPIDSAGT